VRREGPRRQPGVAHREEHHAAVRRQLLAECQERQHVGEPLGLDRDLDDLGRARGQTTHAIREVVWRGLEVVHREHDSPAAPVRDKVVEARARLDVHVLRAQSQRVLQQPAPLLFGAVEPAALPDGPAREDDGHAPALEGAGHVGPRDAIEPELDEVGSLHRVAGGAQALHGGGGHGDAQTGSRHKKSPFNQGG
jgi:hypothetical protein